MQVCGVDTACGVWVVNVKGKRQTAEHQTKEVYKQLYVCKIQTTISYCGYSECSTAYCSTIQYSTVQYSIIQYSAE